MGCHPHNKKFHSKSCLWKNANHLRLSGTIPTEYYHDNHLDYPDLTAIMRFFIVVIEQYSKMTYSNKFSILKVQLCVHIHNIELKVNGYRFYISAQGHNIKLRVKYFMINWTSWQSEPILNLIVLSCMI